MPRPVLHHLPNLRVLRLLPILAGLLLPGLADAATWYVRAGGSDQHSGDSAATAFATLRRAAAVLNHGDTLLIGPGTYRESTLIAERSGRPGTPLQILGDESGARTGDPAGPVVLSSPDRDLPALRLFRVSDATISGLTYHGPANGLVLEQSRRLRVSASTALGCRQGLTLESSEDVDLGACLVDGGAIGVRVRNTVNTRLDRLTILRCSAVGVQVLQSGAGQIQGLLLTANATTMVADRVSASQWRSDYNTFNGLSGPWGAAPPVRNPYEWTAMTGLERHSLFVVPGFVDPDAGDLRIDPTVSWAGGLPGANVCSPLLDWLTTDRDGRPYAVVGGRTGVGCYAYPTAVAGPDWAQLTANIDSAGARFSAGLYAADGSKLRALVDDMPPPPALWWDGRDDAGRPLAATPLTLKAVTHDLQLVDDGNIGDNGSPLGVYQGDSVDRLLALPDGRIVATSTYDEASITWRLLDGSGHAVYGTALRESMFWGVGLWSTADAAFDGQVVGGVMPGARAQLVLLTLPGRRARLPGGREMIPIHRAEDPEITDKSVPADLVVIGDEAYVSLPYLDVVRVYNLREGTATRDLKIVKPLGLAAAAPDAGFWVLSGTDLVHLAADGRELGRLASGLETPRHLDARDGRLGVVDHDHERLRLLAADDGRLLAELGQARTAWWLPVSGRLLREPRDLALLPDGRVMIAEHGRQRAIWPQTGQVDFMAVSNFMESAVVHPTNPRYVYAGVGIYAVDPDSGAWTWVVESPSGYRRLDFDSPLKNASSPSRSMVLGGRPIVLYHANGHIVVADVTEPLRPRIAFSVDSKTWTDQTAYAYATLDLLADGSMLYTQGPRQHVIVPFAGWNPDGTASWDYEARRVIGTPDDPTGRDLKSVLSLSVNRATGDIYTLATTEQQRKMVPGWGADGTGVARFDADGTPRWFSLSSGGNYMSLSALPEADGAWVLAGKSFGGQVDLFDHDGLRLATANWSWPTHYAIGFVDLRYGVFAYRRPDGKLGAYVEDDAIGRFARLRLDGAETVRRHSQSVQRDLAAPTAAAAPLGQGHGVGRQPQRTLKLARLAAALPLDDWVAWEAAGVQSQVIALPSSVGFQRNWQESLMQSYRAGTYMGALAHDGTALYLYLIAADDTPVAPITEPAQLWTVDSFELWLEEDQFGVGLLRDDTPAIYKWRHHDLDGQPWRANYIPAGAQVWGRRLDSLAAHPLGRQLEAVAGVSYARQPGYVMAARIPFAELRLVGGIAGRAGDAILPVTGEAGELLRIAISMNNVDVWGGIQEYMIDWPTGRMFADPTRSQVFNLE